MHTIINITRIFSHSYLSIRFYTDHPHTINYNYRFGSEYSHPHNRHYNFSIHIDSVCCSNHHPHTLNLQHIHLNDIHLNNIHLHNIHHLHNIYLHNHHLLIKSDGMGMTIGMH